MDISVIKTVNSKMHEKKLKKSKNFSKTSFHTPMKSLYYGQKVEAELPF